MEPLTDDEIATVKALAAAVPGKHTQWLRAVTEIERLRAEIADVTAQRDELENGQGHTQARDVLRSIVHQMGIETADPESGVEMTAYELACAVGGTLVGLRGIRDQLRAELQMSEARRELVTAAYERAVKIVEVGPHAAAKREAKELSDSARTLQELQGIVDRLQAALNDASGMAVALGKDRDKLRDRLADYEAAVGIIMAEPCDASERHCTCVPALRIEVDRLRAELLRARAGLMAVESLIEDSQGVYGLHLNGDPAPWSEIRGDGRYCEWLEDYDAAVLESVAGTKGASDGN